MTFQRIREGIAIEVWRIPPGETGPERWDRIHDGIPSKQAANAMWMYLTGRFSNLKMRMVEVTIETKELEIA